MKISYCLLLLCLAATAGCEKNEATFGEPGTPLPGLQGLELAEFEAGAALFNKVFTPEEGVGPLFNENQCSACHTDPAPGGTMGFEPVIKATRFSSDGVCDPLSQEGGENVRDRATPLLMAHGIERAEVPESATEVGRFTTPALFGLGLVEAIPEENLLQHADPNDSNGDGISGRAGRAPDGRFARFSRKAEVATIEEFVASALLFEMGLTNPITPEETTVNGQPIPPGADPAQDPEIGQKALDRLTTFVRFLAPPAPTLPRTQAHSDTLRAGEQLFHEIGCADCHTPTMETGPNEIAALDRKRVNLYSDLLLHDMGPALADVCGYAATPSEVRTEMLMGLGHRNVFLHNGNAYTIEDAILGHGGEAQRARQAFADLPYLRQQYILIFLRSL